MPLTNFAPLVFCTFHAKSKALMGSLFPHPHFPLSWEIRKIMFDYREWTVERETKIDKPAATSLKKTLPEAYI